jgi:beta-1,4-mannosyltransferase
MSENELIVLQSVRKPSSRTNPYIVQLVDSLSEHVDVRYFDWRFGLLGHYDVFQLHWPEVMLRRDGRPQRWAAMARFFLLMLRLTGQRRITVVRTLHNVGVHESGGRVERLLLAWCDRRTDGWIALNEQTRAPRGAATTVILHGDYTTWFKPYPLPSRRPGRILYFGLIRPYKGVDSLLAAFAATDDPQTRLRIVGKPVNTELTELVEKASTDDDRVSARLDYVDDETLADEVGQADLVVLPYQDMHNSGALLLALSLGRPVLVPQAPVTVALAEEVGPGWVQTYTGTLTATTLTEALKRVGEATAGPDLSRRGWGLIAAQHVAVYRKFTGPAS